MELAATNLDDIEVQEYVKGDKEDVECSNRGLCDRDTGICNCFTGYSSSNGFGEIGNAGDCGYVNEVFG
jgi:hypothetical protein